jgi:glucose/arabinose dehydrogenase
MINLFQVVFLFLFITIPFFPNMTQGQLSPELSQETYKFLTYHVRGEAKVLKASLEHPWGMSFLPDGSILITERAGSLHLIDKDFEKSVEITGLPPIYSKGLIGLMAIQVAPDFSVSKTIYFTYTRQAMDELSSNVFSDTTLAQKIVVVLARARLKANSLANVEELLVSDSWDGEGGAAAPLLIGNDGKLYMGIGATRDDSAQNPGSLRGKVLRLELDGRPAEGNPYLSDSTFRPEIFTLGHRNPSGLTLHPTTGELWEVEYGPNGGDEINILKAGGNYGWPIVSLGRDYSGPKISPRPWLEGMIDPEISFLPGISPSGIAFYQGEDFPQWSTSVFVGAQRVGQIPATGHLVRIQLDDNQYERARESILGEIGQRIRAVQMGPDRRLYLLTEEQKGALIVLNPF